MIDTHCHLTFRQYEGRIDEVLADARAAGVRGCITIATTSTDCLHALQIAESHDNVWCSAGVHPLHSDEPLGAEGWANVRRVAEHPKCVAWGELGLDNHYDKPPRSVQDEVLATQLAFIEKCAKESEGGLSKPIIVHCRDAFDELIEVFEAAPFDSSRYVFHCFTAGPAEARRVLDFGAWISFTGVVTFRNASEVAEAAKIVPADRIMVETDAPFLSPEPVRSARPNEPKHVVHIANFIAKLRGVDPAEFERQLDANAERFFGITLTER